MMVEKSPQHHVKEHFFFPGLSQFSNRALFEKSEATPTAW